MQLNHVTKLSQVPRSGLNNALVHIKGSIVALITDNNAIYFYEYKHHDRELLLRDQIVFSSPLIEIESLALSTDEQWLIIATSTALATLTDTARPTVHLYKVLDLTRSLNGAVLFSAVTCLPVYFQPKTVAATPIDQQELLLAVGGGNGVELFRYSSADNHVTPLRLLHDATSISHVTFDASGQYLGIVAADGHVGVWSRDNLLSRTGHIDWFDHVTSERVTHLQFSRHQSQLALSTWDGQLYLYARDAHGGTWHHVALNLLLTHPEKNTNNPGGFVQFAPSGRYLVTCSCDRVILSDTCQNATHTAMRVPLTDITDCVKGLALVDLSAEQCAVLVLTRARDVYCATLPVPLSISGNERCIAEHADAALLLHHATDWRHSPLHLSLRHTDGRHVSFTCPHVSYALAGTAVTCAVTPSHVCLALGPQLLLYEPANDTWRDIFTERPIVGVCFMNDHVVALLDQTLVTWHLSTLTQSGIVHLKIDSEARDTFLVSNGDYCSVVRWQNGTCHMQFFTQTKTGLNLHSNARYDHVTEVRCTGNNLQMTCVSGEIRRITWP